MCKNNARFETDMLFIAYIGLVWLASNWMYSYPTNFVTLSFQMKLNRNTTAQLQHLYRYITFYQLLDLIELELHATLYARRQTTWILHNWMVSTEEEDAVFFSLFWEGNCFKLVKYRAMESGVWQQIMFQTIESRNLFCLFSSLFTSTYFSLIYIVYANHI